MAVCMARIQAVVAWDLDRLHRRPFELEAFMALAHPSTRMLWCGRENCGGYLVGLGDYQTKRPMYRCKTCRSVSIRAEFVEPMVYALRSPPGSRGCRGFADAEIDEAEAEELRAEK